MSDCDRKQRAFAALKDANVRMTICRFCDEPCYVFVDGVLNRLGDARATCEMCRLRLQLRAHKLIR